jgi:pimeloyl-ACP methyl ester carboxylesterase
LEIVIQLVRLAILAWSAGVFDRSAAPCAPARIDSGIRCGTIAVFENRAAGRGRRIPISYVVASARRETGAPPLFLFAGGPGQGSTALVDTALGWAAPIRETRDLVFIDQRGTGGSNPLSCRSRIDEAPERAFGHVFEAEVVTACLAELQTRADLALYTTSHAVDDIDDVRARLGYERVLLWGGSYGTRVAQAYARRHAERVIAVVLDGVAPFDVQLPSTYAHGAQTGLERVFEACRASAGCAEAYPELPRDFETIAARLRAAPAAAAVRTRDGRIVQVKMSLGDFGYAVRGILYDSHATARLPEMIHHAAATDDLSEFAQRYWARAVALERAMALGLHLSVLCAEDVALVPSPEIESRTGTAFLGTYVFDEYRRACNLWPHRPVAPELTRPLDAPIPVLLLSGHFDPVTPPEFGERVARSLPRSRHVVDPSGAHGVTGRCPLPVVIRVLSSGSIDDLPPVCR